MNTFSKPEGRTVLVDMDNTAVDFRKRLEEIFFNRYPDVKPVEKLVTHYGQAYPEHTVALQGIVREKGFFSGLELTNGAVGGLYRIIDRGFVPRICTAPARDHPTCREEKLESIQKLLVPEFGSWIRDTAIIDRDKHLYDGIAIIDDWDHTKIQQMARWLQIVYSQEYNLHIPTDLRLHGWHDPHLEKMLERCDEAYQPRTQAAA